MAGRRGQRNPSHSTHPSPAMVIVLSHHQQSPGSTSAGGGPLVLPAGMDPSALLGALCCPITHEPMQDPVVAADGNSYERQAIQGGYRLCLVADL